jgi:hypothetical protein
VIHAVAAQYYSNEGQGTCLWVIEKGPVELLIPGDHCQECLYVLLVNWTGQFSNGVCERGEESNSWVCFSMWRFQLQCFCPHYFPEWARGELHEDFLIFLPTKANLIFSLKPKTTITQRVPSEESRSFPFGSIGVYFNQPSTAYRHSYPRINTCPS